MLNLKIYSLQNGKIIMSKLIQVLLVALTAVLLCVIGFLLYKQASYAHQMTELSSSLTEQKQLLDNISRSQSQYASKDDIAAFAKSQNIALDVITNDLSSLGAKVEAINGITVISQGQTAGNLSSTTTIPRTDTPSPQDAVNNPYGYLTNAQRLSLNEDFTDKSQVPIGTVGFSAWKDKPWDIQILPRHYSITSVLGVDANGKHYNYNKFSIIVNDKPYDVKIDDNKFLEEAPSSTFSWWNPHLFLTAGGGMQFVTPVEGTVNGGATVGVMSYGQFKSNPSISILQVGVGYQTQSRRPAAVLNPIQFNMGKLLTGGFIDNTYLGPSLQMDSAGKMAAGINLSVGL